MDFTLNDAQRQLQLTLRRFVEREVMPVASEYEHADAYPDAIVTQMADLGLFGCILPVEYGGQGCDYISYAIICEELSRGFIGGHVKVHGMDHKLNAPGLATMLGPLHSLYQESPSLISVGCSESGGAGIFNP